MERRRRDRLPGGKKGAAALLAAVFTTVVFAASPEWVAWQGPLVVGALDVQTTDSGLPPLGEEPSGADGLFVLLALVSAVAALLLTWKRLEHPGDPSPADDAKPVRSPVRPKAIHRDPVAGRAPLTWVERVDSSRGAGIE